MNDITNDHSARHRSPLGRSRLRRAALLAVAAAGVALLAAACSGATTTTTVITTPPTTAAPPAAASTATPATTAPATTAPATTAPATTAPTTYQLAVAYAACMRSHGIPKYPDPDPRYVQAGLTGPGYIAVQALNITMQQFNSASHACLQFRPGYGRTW